MTGVRRIEALDDADNISRLFLIAACRLSVKKKDLYPYFCTLSQWKNISDVVFSQLSVLNGKVSLRAIESISRPIVR